MSNMSYCRFENTTNALRDCLDAMEEEFENKGTEPAEFLKALSETEQQATHHMYKLCRRFVELYDEAQEEQR